MSQDIFQQFDLSIYVSLAFYCLNCLKEANEARMKTICREKATFDALSATMDSAGIAGSPSQRCHATLLDFPQHIRHLHSSEFENKAEREQKEWE